MTKPHEKTTVFLTGASGNMGFEGFKQLLERRDRFDIVALVKPSPRDVERMRPFEREEGVTLVWGDLTRYEDVLQCVSRADIVLHVGGIVSPFADHHPELAMTVNVGAARNIVKAIRAQPDPDRCKLVYIGTVAQTGDRNPPLHWGRTGDPIYISEFDHYAVSKTLAEREVIESGLRYWVSLRQTGIAHLGLLDTSDPIMFHVPLDGVLEWVTAADSGRLIANICEADVPEEFWRRIYNIGGGASCRVTNIEFAEKTNLALGIGDFRKTCEPNWFATRNFHGQWYTDSDLLESYLHFRRESVDDFIAQLRSHLGWRHWALRLVPSALVRSKLTSIAQGEGGTLSWFANGDEDKIRAYFGSVQAWREIPGWKDRVTSRPSDQPRLLDHGYDEGKPAGRLDLLDMRRAAEFRGGACLAAEMSPGDLQSRLRWRCAFGHEFDASPTLVLKAGHWCPACMPAPWNYREQAERSAFLAQVVRP
jgi:nucleoside-diphosphate-sugar epimerase